MEEYNGPERRDRGRVKLVTFCPTSFECDGAAHHALMTDVSETGAGFIQQGDTTAIDMKTGVEVCYTVHTPYGESTCSGTTIWSKRGEQQYSWGIRFTHLSDNAKDPLRSLLDSPF